MSTLSNEVIKLSSIRETAKRELTALMDQMITGGDRSKFVLIDPALVDAFKYSGVTTEVFKRERGVQGIYSLTGDLDFSGQEVRNLVIFLQPHLSILQTVANAVTAFTTKSPRAAVYIVFVPKKTLMAVHVLEEEHKLRSRVKDLHMMEFDLDFVPLDDDVLSMELPSSYKSLYLDGDISMLQWVAKAIIKMQTSRFGPIPLIQGKGPLAAKVVSIVRRLQHEVGEEMLQELTPEIEAMYVVDRGMDVLTPMLTQLTYEGLIEELYGIQSAHFDPPFEISSSAAADASTATAAARERKIPLNGNDRMFSEIRDKNFSTVGSVLYQKSVWVKNSYERRKEVQGLKDLKEFMKGLPEMQEFHRLIGVHTNIATNIGKVTQENEFRTRIRMEQLIVQGEDEKAVLEYIEELIYQEEPLILVLRLLCALSIMNNGLKPKVLDSMKEACMYVYGIPQIIAAFYNLERCGLLVKQRNDAPRSVFSSANMRKQCRLWSDDLKENNPTDIAYAYSGYAPLLSRVIESMSAPAPGETNVAEVVGDSRSDFAEIRNPVEVPGTMRVVVIFVIGGLTHAEMSTIRFLEQKLASQGEPKHFVIATTEIISGEKLMRSLLPFNPSAK